MNENQPPDDQDESKDEQRQSGQQDIGQPYLFLGAQIYQIDEQIYKKIIYMNRQIDNIYKQIDKNIDIYRNLCRWIDRQINIQMQIDRFKQKSIF